MRIHRRPSPTRRGAILVLVAVLLIVLIAFVGLAVDTGNITLAKTQLQNVADSAAVAAASQLLDRDELKGSPDQSTEIVAARNLAQSLATSNQAGGASIALDANNPNSTSGDIVVGYLANPMGDRNALALNTGTPPVAFSPPLLFLPAVTSIPVPFVTPPTVNSTYKSANSVQIIAHRDGQRNGALPLFFGGVNGFKNIGLTATATATYEDNIIGFRIDPNGPATSKLLPFAMDVNTYGAMAAGLSSLDLYRYDPTIAPTGNDYSARVKFADLSLGTLLSNTGSALSILLDPTRYTFNPTNLSNPLSAPLDPALAALLPGDRIKETLLIPLLVPDIILDPVLALLGIKSEILNKLPILGNPVRIGNFGTIYIGNGNGSNADFVRQLQFGPNATDFAAMGGSFKLGSDGILVVNGDAGLTATVKTLLASIKGQPRIIPLYQKTTTPGGLSGLLSAIVGQTPVTYTIVGFGGIVILDLLDIPDRLNLFGLGVGGVIGLKLLAQPEFVIDPTAIGGGAALSNGGKMTSRFIYRPLAISR